MDPGDTVAVYGLSAGRAEVGVYLDGARAGSLKEAEEPTLGVRWAGELPDGGWHLLRLEAYADGFSFDGLEMDGGPGSGGVPCDEEIPEEQGCGCGGGAAGLLWLGLSAWLPLRRRGRLRISPE